MRAIIDMRIERTIHVGDMFCTEMMQRHTQRFRAVVMPELIERINEWIHDRVSDTRDFRVKEFMVKITDHHGMVIKEWRYEPTYRK